jgi:hypothetical protein
LAAIQAELLRMLLFSDSTRIPATTPPEASVMATHVLPLRTALARAIALILVRATLTPSAVQHRKTEEECSVRIVLPALIDQSDLTWQDLEPWHADEATEVQSLASSSSALTVYSIPALAVSAEETLDSN